MKLLDFQEFDEECARLCAIRKSGLLEHVLSRTSKLFICLGRDKCDLNLISARGVIEFVDYLTFSWKSEYSSRFQEEYLTRRLSAYESLFHHRGFESHTPNFAESRMIELNCLKLLSAWSKV